MFIHSFDNGHLACFHICLLWMMLIWTWIHKYLFHSLHSILLGLPCSFKANPRRGLSRLASGNHISVFRGMGLGRESTSYWGQWLWQPSLAATLCRWNNDTRDESRGITRKYAVKCQMSQRVKKKLGVQRMENLLRIRKLDKTSYKRGNINWVFKIE